MLENAGVTFQNLIGLKHQVISCSDMALRSQLGTLDLDRWSNHQSGAFLPDSVAEEKAWWLIDSI